MSRLEALPERAIIDGFKGKIDFYLWKDIPCARRWPKKPSMPRSPGVIDGQQLFAHTAQLATQLSPSVIAAFEEMAQEIPLTWKDLFFKAYINGST